MELTALEMRLERHGLSRKDAHALAEEIYRPLHNRITELERSIRPVDAVSGTFLGG